MEVNRPRPKQCVIQKISILPPPPPRKGIFCKTPPLWKFRLIFIHFLIFFGVTDPSPAGNLNPLCGGVSIFSGTAQLSDGAVVQFECDDNNNNNNNNNNNDNDNDNNDNNNNDNNRDFAC